MPDWTLEELARGVSTVGMGGHISPDGDCIGAALALSLYLARLLPEDARIEIFMDQLQTEFRDLPGTERIITDGKSSVESFDLFFALDCGRERLGDARKHFDQAKKTVNIDHHVSNPGTGDLNFIVPGASSTCELVCSLFDRSLMDADIAQNIYVGVAHDTGVFQYSNTSPETLRLAADLISYGFDFSALLARTYYEKSYDQNRLLGQALIGSRLFLDGLMIGSVITKKQMQDFHVRPGQLDGIVSKLRETRGVDCAVLIYPLDNGDNKVSLRSSGGTDVALIGQKYGGGGHVRAAGCNMKGSGEECLMKLVKDVEEQLKAREEADPEGASDKGFEGLPAAEEENA